MKRISPAALPLAFLSLFVSSASAQVATGRRPVIAKAAARAALAARPAPVFAPTVWVRLAEGRSIDLVAAGAGLRVIGPSRLMPGSYLLRGATARLALRGAERLRTSDGVLEVRQDRKLNLVPRQDSEPLFAPRRGYVGQWVLANSEGGVDAGFRGAWDIGRFGTGVRVGIVDDGIDRANVDVGGAVIGTFSYDFVDDDNDPSPRPENGHGTAMAGLIAARENGAGIMGGAPSATLADLRALGGTELNLADGIGHLGMAPPFQRIDIKLHAYGPTDFFAEAPFALISLRNNRDAGALDVVAAGNEADNGGLTNDDTAKDPFANSPGAIVVTAHDFFGEPTDYTNYGANVFLSAPGHGSGYGVMTTDNVGDGGYATIAEPDPIGGLDFVQYAEGRGTSTAAALVTAALANARSANNNIGDRLARHLLMRSVVPTPASSEGAVVNAAGRVWSPKMGFGRLNAGALVSAAEVVRGVSERIETSSLPVRVGASIPDGGAPLAVAVPMTSVGEIEDVQVTLSISHPYRGDLSAQLVSPSGTRIPLFRAAPADATSNLNTTFTTPAFWGEQAAGNWRVEVRDEVVGDAGVLVSVQVHAAGGSILRADYDDSQLVSQSGPVRLNPGASTTVPVTMLNSGTRVWDAREGYRLAPVNADARAFGTATVSVGPNPIVAGASRAFSIPVTAPDIPGDYRLVYRMQRGFLSFGETTSIDVKVPLLWDSEAAPGLGSVTIPRGSSRVVSFPMRNVGARPWVSTRAGAGSAFRLMPVSDGGLGVSGMSLRPGISVPVFGTYNFSTKIVGARAGTYYVKMRMDRGTKGTAFGAESAVLEVIVR